MPRERTLQTNVIKWLNQQDFTIAHNYHVGGFGINGYPDIIAFVYGVGLLIETKTEVGKLSKAQIALKEKFEKNGVLYLVARNLDDVKQAHNAVRRLVLKRGSNVHSNSNNNPGNRRSNIIYGSRAGDS